MSFRKTAFVLALVSAAVTSAFASSGTTLVGGDRGYESHYMPGTKTRAEVLKELQAYRKNPVTADGGTLVGGEVGYVPPQHSFAVQSGNLVHADNIPHNTPKPSLVMTEAERRLYKELYTN